MDNIKLFFKLYFNPAAALSDIMDSGSLMFAAVAVLLVSMAFFATVNTKLDEVYRIRTFSEFYSPNYEEMSDDAAVEKARFNQATTTFNEEMARRPKIPVVGDSFFKLFSFESTKFYQPLILLSVFYIPVVILLMCIFGGIGSFGLVARRDYGTLAVCTLNAWAAAHLPFAIVGILLYSQPANPQIYLAIWAASGLIFGLLMIFVIRTVFGANYGTAILVVGIAWLSLSAGMFIFRFASPWMFSPFLLFYAVIYFGGYLGGEARGFGNAFRQKQNFKRFLHNATVNPNDADAHVQLGIIYLQRRQESKAVEHLNKAVEIDKNEIDANYELGKIARSNGDLQTALDHFTVVVEQNDKYALSEIWREIGVTYFSANMLAEARDALEKYVERRSVDAEGLYHLGKVLKAQGETDRASEMFAEAVASAKASPNYRRNNTRQWGKLAQKEI